MSERLKIKKVTIKNPTSDEILRIISHARATDGIIATAQRDLISEVVVAHHVYSPRALKKPEKVWEIHEKTSCHYGRFTEIAIWRKEEI